MHVTTYDMPKNTPQDLVLNVTEKTGVQSTHVFKAHGKRERERERERLGSQIDRHRSLERERTAINFEEKHDHDRISLNSSFEIIELKSPIQVYT